MKTRTVPVSVGELVRGFVAGVVGTKEPSARLLRDLAAAARTFAQAPAGATAPASRPAKPAPRVVCARCGRAGHANARDAKCPKRQQGARQAGAKPPAAKPSAAGDKDGEPPPAPSPAPLPSPLPAPLEQQRKCSPFPRAHSRSFTRTVQRREAQGKLTGVYERNPQLPLTRAECKDGPRPCPILSCRHHLAFSIDEERGSVKEHYPHFGIWKDPEGPGLEMLQAAHGSCALDIADGIEVASLGGAEGEGIPGLLALAKTAVSGQPIGQTEGATLEETAKRLNLGVERVRQLGAIALQNVRVALRRAEGAQPGPAAVRHRLRVVA